MAFGDQFLNEPALFPARLAGDPCGGARATLDLPGGPYHVAGLSEGQFAALAERYGDRLDPGPSPDRAVDVRLFLAQEAEFSSVEREGRLNTFDFRYQQHAVHMAGRRMMAQVSWRPTLQAALWTCLDEETELLETFENFFRTVVAYRLLEHGGAVLHSSGVSDGTQAWIFYGHSGAGKTTLARRCQATGHSVLSDDINALFVDAGRAYVAKMPFAGELGRSNARVGPYPLAGLHGLEQSASTSWRPLSGARAVAALVSCAPFLNHDRYRLPRLMENLENVVRRTPAGVLAFNLEDDFWPHLHRAAHEEIVK